MRYEAESSDNKLMHALKAVVIGASAGALLLVLFLLVISGILVAAKSLPQNLLSPIVLVACGLSSFFAGYVCVRIARMRGMLYGILTGLLLFTVVFVEGVIAVNEPLSFEALVKGLLMTLCGAVGGIIGVNKRRKRK